MTSAVALKAVVAAILLAAIAGAFVGPPPRRIRPALALASGFLGVILYPLGVLVAAGREPLAGSVVIAAAVVCLALAIWAARGRGDDGGEEVMPEGDPPVDWERFDRLRDDWERRGPRVGL